MKHHDRVADAFGTTASAYLTSAVHATGTDLDTFAAEIGATPGARVLDLGCGAGHASFAAARGGAHEVIAYDLAPQMLATVEAAARERGLSNVRIEQGAAERLPFADALFDWIVSRMSAHHWHDVPRALAEARRVLKPGGRVLFVDVAGADHPLADTHLQAVEVLRDASHVRDYRVDEWLAFFAQAGFAARVRERWRLSIGFDGWVARMRTPDVRAHAIRALWADAPDEVRAYFDVQPDGSFKLDVVMIDAR
ncbi:S-adenosyl-L-methionine-dependent methyltransferase family protein [Burkholderia pseudomallei MSHR2990]|uniref:class I SAM-dependent methyltransferase n=1 Tax=Burkholderia pseudomallei TaxID=28450 RepID=UPI000537DF10|nr:class I SAM-dependent methyltransferase [Burkholderia pseudomallei]KGW79455.1 S-adenosyl-L-methionine-dependent methyltransferase family protein [Burkholderia pseudomallei MSHR2990]